MDVCGSTIEIFQKFQKTSSCLVQSVLTWGKPFLCPFLLGFPITYSQNTFDRVYFNAKADNASGRRGQFCRTNGDVKVLK